MGDWCKGVDGELRIEEICVLIFIWNFWNSGGYGSFKEIGKEWGSRDCGAERLWKRYTYFFKMFMVFE